MSDQVLTLTWLSVWSKEQMICIWSIWCHCHPIVSCFIKIQIGLTFLMPSLARFSWKRRCWTGVCLSVWCWVMWNRAADAADATSAYRAMQLCHKSPSDDCWHRSHFGSHPRMVVTTRHSGVSLLDLRVCLHCIEHVPLCNVDRLSVKPLTRVTGHRDGHHDGRCFFGSHDGRHNESCDRSAVSSLKISKKHCSAMLFRLMDRQDGSCDGCHHDGCQKGRGFFYDGLKRQQLSPCQKNNALCHDSCQITMTAAKKTTPVPVVMGRLRAVCQGL